MSGSRTAPTSSRSSTSAAPPMWSRCGWVSTSAVSSFSQLVELGGHLGLGRALVDQYCALRDLEEDGVALAHVEHRDP